MRILVSGSRDWTDIHPINRELARFTGMDPSRVTLIEGGARGADLLARKVAENLGWNVEEYPAKWDEYGPAAGPIRNQEMLDSGINVAFCFHPFIFNSKGTLDMYQKLINAQVLTYLVNR